MGCRDHWLGAVALVAVAASHGLGAGYTNTAITEPPDAQVRYTSGRVVYVERWDGERWLGRYWSSDGRINLPYDGWAEEAFRIEIGRVPVSTGWKWVSAVEAPKSERGARHVVVTLRNPQRALDVNVHTLLDGTAVLTRWLELTNTADKPVALTAVEPWSGRLWRGRNFTLGYFTKAGHTWEGWFDWRDVAEGTTVIRCDRGQGHDDPFFLVRNNAVGEYFIGHLAWSANWRMAFTRDAKTLRFGIGPSAAAAQRVIAPGETIKTPAVHLGHVSGDLDAAVQAMHEHLRRFVLLRGPQARAYRVQYLVPADQGYYTPFNESSAMKCVDVAAAVGAELFILDAYWWDVTCDWIPSATRFPRGLKPLVDAVHEKGMLFGLYVEAEGGRGNVRKSKVAKTHPDWLGPHDIINLAIPEAAAWVESEICRLITEHHLDLFRLDYNPQNTGEGIVTTRDGTRENNYWRYYEACYAMYERIHKRYPDLILQQCAAGGARNDLGTVSRFHESYVTDGLILPREIQDYAGLTLGLPPEIFLILHGATGTPGVGYSHNLDTVLRITFTLATPQIFVGTVAPSVETLSPERRERYLHYGRIYKTFIRPILPVAKMYHHAPVTSRGGVDSSGWFAMEYAAPDRAKGWATIVRIGASESDRYVFKPRGLDRGRVYRVTFDSTGETARVDGLRWIQEGLPIRLEAVMSSELLLWEAQ